MKYTFFMSENKKENLHYMQLDIKIILSIKLNALYIKYNKKQIYSMRKNSK